ncbi:cupin domain-containing protein [Rahnella sp. CG8]|uniref:cupin domain-containing protein n=1 Tax=Rahnella sp. CG8 TaxID=2726078 RepID=UPI002034A18F|nr:cupin domain-containing protein [Rahnella sp. CG8]MCM2448471.1 cupin domain-containing protein [Rahnella sp. CG8]
MALATSGRGVHNITTTGAKHFSMGTEIIMPGKEIPLHRHMHSEEVVVVQQGSVEAILNDKHQVIGQGGMAYAPPDTWMSFKNIFEIPATVLWIFSTPGFEEYVRETSVKKGEAVIPFTPDELTHVRKRYLQLIELSAPFDVNYPSDID